MNVKIIILIFLWFITGSVSAGIINDKNNSQVNDVDLDVLLEVAPVKEQKKLLNNKGNLKKQIEQIYLKKVLAKEAKEDGLDKEPMNAARLQAIIDNALFLLKLNELKKENKKDYANFAKQLYEVNKEDYKVKERVDAAHILISTKELSDEQALEKIRAIRGGLVLGADFSEVALKESDDKSVKRNQGELGAFTKQQMVKPFTDAAFLLKPNELSEPIKTRFGYHLIKLNKHIPAGYKTFNEVKDELIAKLKEKDWEIDRDEYYKQLKKKNEMQIDEKALDTFVVKKLLELDAKQ